MASTFLAIRFCSCWIWPATSVSALSITSSLVRPASMYSLLISINSAIICVRYSLLMNGFETPIVNFLASGAAGCSGALVGSGAAGCSGALVASGALVGSAGAWVGCGATQAVSTSERTVIRVASNITVFLDMFIFSYLSELRWIVGLHGRSNYLMCTSGVIL